MWQNVVLKIIKLISIIVNKKVLTFLAKFFFFWKLCYMTHFNSKENIINITFSMFFSNSSQHHKKSFFICLLYWNFYFVRKNKIFSNLVLTYLIYSIILFLFSSYSFFFYNSSITALFHLSLSLYHSLRAFIKK